MTTLVKRLKTIVHHSLSGFGSIPLYGAEIGDEGRVLQTVEEVSQELAGRNLQRTQTFVLT